MGVTLLIFSSCKAEAIFNDQRNFTIRTNQNSTVSWFRMYVNDLGGSNAETPGVCQSINTIHHREA